MKKHNNTISEYEKSANVKLSLDNPCIVKLRLHNYNRLLEHDKHILTVCMSKTLEHLLGSVQGCEDAYLVNDTIILILSEKSPLYGFKMQKIITHLTGYATAVFEKIYLVETTPSFISFEQHNNRYSSFMTVYFVVKAFNIPRYEIPRYVDYAVTLANHNSNRYS